MVINIWAGESPKEPRNHNEINILINRLAKDHESGHFIHLISDPRYIKSLHEVIVPTSNYEDVLFIAAYADCQKITKNFKNKIAYKVLGRDGFSFDIDNGFYHGCSTVYIGIQLGIFLGGKEINIFGTTYSYGTMVIRPSNFSDLPDPLISKTQMVIANHRNKILNCGVQIFFKGTVL
jgi:hypothetical protein